MLTTRRCAARFLGRVPYRESVELQESCARELKRAQLGARGVVDGNRAAELARANGAEDGFELAASGPALEAAGDHDRLPVGRHPHPLELVDDRCDGLLARVVGRTRQRQRARLDDDRNAGAAGDEIGEAWPRQRVAERLADRGSDVTQRVERGWRREQDGIVLDGDERDARAREERNAGHAPIQPADVPARQPMARWSRKNVGRNPSRGHVRDDSRFVARQSVTTAL